MFTIVKDFRQEIVIEKSRFICTLKKVHSEAEAQEFIKTIKKEFLVIVLFALLIIGSSSIVVTYENEYSLIINNFLYIKNGGGL